MKNLAFSEFSERLRTGFDDLTTAERTIANFILVDPEAIPYETADSLADRLELSAITIGRFCRKFGFRNFRELKSSMKFDVAALPWADRAEFERLAEDNNSGTLSEDLKVQITNLTAVYGLARGSRWDSIVAILADTPKVHVAGFQTERGVAQHFAHLMQYARPGVHLADIASGNFADVLAGSGEASDECLLIVESRRYSRQAKELAERAAAHGMPVIIVTDRFCDWAPTITDKVLALPTESTLFWTTMVPLVALLTLLADAVVLRLGPDTVTPRLEAISELFASFTGHTGQPR